MLSNGTGPRWKAGRVFRRCTKCRRPIKRAACDREGCNGNQGTWYFVVDIGRRGIPGNQVMRGGFRTREAALATMHSLQQSVRSGDYVSPSDVTVQQLLEHWLAGRKNEIRDSTHMNYAGDIGRVVPLIGEIPVQAVTTPMLRKTYDALVERDYKVTTIQKIHSVLTMAFHQAVEDRLIARNPAKEAFRLRVPYAATRSLTESEVKALLAYERPTTEYAAELLLTRGLRPGEVCALLDRDVHLADGWLVVERTMSRRYAREGEPGAKIRSEPENPKTPAGQRRIDLDPETVKALSAYRTAQALVWEGMGAAYEDRGYFFAHADGRPWDPNSMSGKFRRHMRKSNRDVHLYVLRHTAASLAATHGVPIREIQEMLGHASLRSTERYIHLLPGTSARTTRIIASAIENAAGDAASSEPAQDGRQEQVDQGLGLAAPGNQGDGAVSTTITGTLPMPGPPTAGPKSVSNS